MWSEPIYVEERDLHVILLDFEGFSSQKLSQAQSASADAILFSLACLLSSTVMLNSMTPKNGDLPLDHLKFLTDISSHVLVQP